MKQVSKEHYSFETYCYPDRWGSYYYQIRELLKANPKSVLEIGAGDGTVRHYVMQATSPDYKTLDVADDLHPDIVGSLLSMPVKDKSFDIVCAFEVLEHIPYADVSKALSEMRRVAKNKVLISVPHFGPPIRFSFKIPFLPEMRFLAKVPYPKKHEWNGQHYWELGKKGYPVSAFRKLLSKHFEIESEFVPFENAYHHFFILSV